ncbi:MAG: MraY family glycosyltransferase [Candidatus Cloacimonetes bacterium]|nr:MraY family glycosyltransferase [Candidatus Cloacimonadota bacterium]
MIDLPQDRKIHLSAMPLSGGLSFAIPMILAPIAIALIIQDNSSKMILLSVASLLMVVIGTIDDKIHMSAYIKLLFQLILSFALYVGGFRIEMLTNPLGSDISLGFFSLPFTITWIILIINATNLIDGLDGMAAGIALIVNLTLFAVSINLYNIYLILLTSASIGCYLAFLRFNFHPAKIFMGDAGSMLIGLNIAAISIMGNAQLKGITAMTLLIPIASLFIPIVDTMLAVQRRLRKKKNIFIADKEHFHHRMLEFGFSQKTIALISYFITLLFGLIGFGFSFSTKRILLVILFLLFSLFFIVFYRIIKRRKK